MELLYLHGLKLLEFFLGQFKTKVKNINKNAELKENPRWLNGY